MDSESWLKEFNGPRSEWREGVLNMSKHAIRYMGRKVSELIVDFIFQVSHRDDDRTSIVIRSLKHSIGTYMGHAENLVIVDRIFALLETGERGLRERDPYIRLRNKGTCNEEQQIRLKQTCNEQLEGDEEQETLPLFSPRLVYSFGFVNKIREQIVFLEYLVCLVLQVEVDSPKVMNDFFHRCDTELNLIRQNLSLNKKLAMLANDDHGGDCKDEADPSMEDDDYDDGDDDYFDDDDDDPLKDIMKIRVEELWSGFELYL